MVYCARCAGHIDTPLTSDGIAATLEALFNDPDSRAEWAEVARAVLQEHGIPSHIHPDVYRRAGIDPGDSLPLFAWPGGSTLVYYDEDNDPVCADCATCDAFSTRIVAVDTYDEGPDLFCSCGAIIAASYGDPEGGDDMNAITSLIVDEWNDYVNSIDDDETIIGHARTIDETSARAAVDAWLDALLEIDDQHYTPIRGRAIPQPLIVRIARTALEELDYAAIADRIMSDAREAVERIEDAVMYLVDGHHGIYSLQYLCESWRDNLYADDEDIAIALDGPEHEHYNDVFSDIVDAGMFIDGHDYHLYTGDGIWAVRDDVAFLLPDDWPY